MSQTKLSIPVFSSYCSSWQKRLLDLAGAVFAVIIGFPVLITISLFILIDSGWPVIFIQRRVGIGGHVFPMYKFRTMRPGAESDQERYRQLNEADGPVFKIANDPRFERTGRWLSRTGLDELPQLWNVIRGDMSLVGPRPFPVEEFRMIDPGYQAARVLVKPGIMCRWVIRKNYHDNFKAWMDSDFDYIRQANLNSDIEVLCSVMKMCIRLVLA